MPPKKKKQQYNGFMMYMLEVQADMRKQGRKMTIEELVPITRTDWNEMPEAQRQEYNQLAKQKKKEDKTRNGYEGKMDCTGQLITNRFSVKDYLDQRRATETGNMASTWPAGGDIVNHPFHMISVKTLCKLPDDTYLPCELACVEYTLSEGIRKRFHCFPYPGRLPLGFRFLCQQGEERHKIPAENFDEYNSEYKQIWRDLCAFINPNRHQMMPPLFCELRCREEVEFTLEWLARNAGMSHNLRKVYEMDVLILELFKHAGEMMPSRTQVSDLLATSAWDFMWDTRCAYHEETEVTLENCALGTCNKYCYCLSDAVCPRYGVELTPNHIPEAEAPAAIIYPAQPSQVGGPRGARSSPPRGRPSPPRGRGASPRGTGSGSGGGKKGAGAGLPPGGYASSTRMGSDSDECAAREGHGIPGYDDTPLRQPSTMGIAHVMAQPKQGFGGDDRSYTSSVQGGASRYAGQAEPPTASNVPLPMPAWQGITTIPQEKPGAMSHQAAMDDLASQLGGLPLGAAFRGAPKPGLGPPLGVA